MIGEEIGAFGFGEAEDELENIGSLTPQQANWYAKRWALWFKRRGASVVYRRNVEGLAPFRVNTYAFFRHLKDSEMVGGVQASDVAILLYPAPLKANNLEWPPLQGDMIVRRPGKAEETLFTALASPHVIDVSDVDIVIRMIARVGGGRI